MPYMKGAHLPRGLAARSTPRPRQAEPSSCMSDAPTSLGSDGGWAIEAVLARGEPVWFTAHGNSMRPLIMPGARLRIVPASGESLCAGDVALCRVQGRLLLHRVWRVRAEALWLRGDNQLSSQRVAHAQVLGRLDASEGGRLVLDGYTHFRRLGAARLVLARGLNRGYRASQRLLGPVRRVRRRLGPA